jgi:energy-coupling factor transport system ATP-binding protein
LAEHRLERVIGFVDRIILIHGDGSVDLGPARQILSNSPIAPPLVELAKKLELGEIPLSIREFRKMAPEINQAPVQAIAKINGDALFTINSVSASYDQEQRKNALHNVNIQINGGEIVALMGRNGAGKTTLLKCAVGQAPLIRGEIRVKKRDPKSFTDKELIRFVGYIPQDAGDLLYGQSIKQECELADLDNGVEPGTTLAIYKELMKIPSLNSHPRDISEGQRLGLALSIILSAQPALVILDEPTRGLDYEAKKVLIKNLKEIASNLNRAVLISTHDVELVAEVADRVIFLADGEVIADGSSREVLKASPAFAPQVSKALPNNSWLSLSDVERYLSEKN